MSWGLGYSLTLEGWHSFTMLQVMAILGPALDQRFYPSHPDYDQCTEDEGLMMAYARGAALATMSFLSRQGELKIKLPRPTGSLYSIGPQEYLDKILLQQAINMLQAFDAVVPSPNITNLSPDDRPYLVTMLKEAMSYNQDLVKEFSESMIPAQDARHMSKLLVSPLPPDGATFSRNLPPRVMQARGFRPSAPKPIHNSVDLIRLGLTCRMHKPLRRYIKVELGKEESLG